MCWVVGVKALIAFQVDEEILPFEADTLSEIIPQSLDSCVVNTSVKGCRVVRRCLGLTLKKKKWKRGMTYRPHIYDPLAGPISSSMISAHNIFSVP